MVVFVRTSYGSPRSRLCSESSIGRCLVCMGCICLCAAENAMKNSMIVSVVMMVIVVA